MVALGRKGRRSGVGGWGWGVRMESKQINQPTETGAPVDL